MTTRIERRGAKLLIRAPRGHALAELRTLGARWDAAEGAWSLPAALWLLEWANDLLDDVEADTGALSLYGGDGWSDVVDQHPATWGRLAQPGQDLAPGSRSLFDFQRVGAGRLIAAYKGRLGGQLLAMSPGLGKTATAIVAADLTGIPDGGVLVITPASLQRTWRREIEAWSRHPVTIHPQEPRAFGYHIMSIDTFKRHAGKLPGPWPLAILDESVLAKSHNSQRFKALEAARVGKGKFIEHLWCLSGFPITRYTDDLWAQLRLIAPGLFSSYWRFAERYCYVEENEWGPGKVVLGSRLKVNAAADNRDIMYVVNQDDVLDLPEYLFEAVDVELTAKQRKAYVEMTKSFRAELDGRELEAASKVARLMRLVSIVSGLGDLGSDESAKHDAVMELIGSGVFEGPHLVWTHWSENAARLHAKMLKAGIRAEHVHGKLSNAEKDRRLEAFKAGDQDVLILSLGVGKFGHTFTDVKTVHYLDKTWNADDYTQSLRRVRRIGLKHRPVVVTYRAPGTVDELIEANLEGKLGPIAKLTNARLRELLLGLGQ